ncbi:ABC transporter permease [Polymorphobacter sp.]|uniref:ABC transporter permease n=1 Tax=Polymorphobacter sp. TaxID=1909290 RepID=UPI003F6FF071
MVSLGFDPPALEGDARTLAFRGRLTIAHVQSIAEPLAELPPGGSTLAIDLTAVERIDTAGALLVHQLMARWQAAGVDVSLVTEGPDAPRLIAEVAKHDDARPVPPEPQNKMVQRLERIGRATVDGLAGVVGFLAFIGQTLVVLGKTLVGRRKLRWNAFIHQCEAIGVNALGIIALLLFLVGVVVAQQGATQLRQFGADIFVVNLIGRATMRELGILLTAIMVAGRSASAFAAQIGSMKLNQEVDALETIGLSPIEVLVIPRVLAMALMTLVLGFFGSVCAIVGGGVYVWLALDMPPVTYIGRLQEVVLMSDFVIGLIKAPVFGLVIALQGCYQGMQVRGNAEDVGARTTRAVVESIFMVIVLDAFFAVFFSALGYN